MTDYTEYYEYVTKEGDRWDLIANEYYGDPMKYEPIISANPNVPIKSSLQSGIKLQIPVINKEESLPEELPPWKR